MSDAAVRRLIAIESVSLDGVIQSPGQRDEDTSGGFSHGGWIGRYTDPVLTGPHLHVFGSASLLQTLLAHDLVDALWLKVFPITLGGGKRPFADGTIPAAFEVTRGTVTPKGVIVVDDERTGAITTAA